MKLLLVLTLYFLCFASLYSQEKDAYIIYKSDGTKSSYSEIIKEAEKSDILMIGELHNNAVSHWLEFELTKDINEIKNGKITLGAEMFESDDQLVLDEYLSGKISDNNFKTEAKLWQNYKTDYKPLVDFAKTNKLKFIATNIPRRYASLVYSRGLESLDSIAIDAYQWIVPLPFEIDMNLNCYKDILEKAGGHGGENLPKSQAIKDATMAYFIDQNFEEKNLFIHYNGSYHSENHEAICWYLKKYDKNYKILTLTTIEQDDIKILEKENINKADFIIAVPASFTKTY